MDAVDHARATELFSDYLDQDLGPAELGALEEHLKSCVVCRREYQAFQKTVGALSGLDKMVAPPEFAEEVRARIRKRSRNRFFTPGKLATRVPYELFSLLMLGLILAIYVLLQMATPGHLSVH